MSDFSSSLPFEARVMERVFQAGLGKSVHDELRHLTDLHRHIEDYYKNFEAAFQLKESLIAQCRQLAEAISAPVRGGATAGGVEDRIALGAARSRLTLLQRWTAIAFRDSVMTISHFDDALTAFNVQLKESTHLPLSQITAPKAWNKTFVIAFPAQKNARNTVAHEAENYTRPNRRKGNAMKGPFEITGTIKSDGGKVSISRMMTEDSITYSRDGNILESKLDQGAVNALMQCVRQIEDYITAIISVATAGK
ncbi:hypothetical protein [Allorhizobium taibaishanense]|uniref:Uncharacterized protein n=1 Tax=Allorhizobium taibaishanense TaxID=887144 RepID=A0A1Q9A2S1_9HYPH|nr:hypothetical protein [Allorhizobium taibaishanense]MBB4005783.1 hypothetical protein [Allorhizobium taibaishanense]OLP48832.1 hypothetical protein BJF91_17000 [Allorhizobium taibaishanense]